MMVNFKNPTTNQVKQTKAGFSWTVFFFGFWPALFRGDWKWFAIILTLNIVSGIFTFGLGAGLINLIFSFIYNKLYINDLISNGWHASDESSKSILVSKGFITN
ncbi:DUF2628 domain-containing protein [Pediococcus acidilactici]|jgi:hypothetical protein|uniref:DUF2628 domain-containing protein n=1 Tax=Pediococcus acidilactici TaxID=1254 RepID=UPI000E5CE65F|nr:DUF2628 domain-containing protein [Pediococcus acidilactici]KAF0514797.1 DUF2628 domain-containing protein [Pediococcus acidilactici]MCT3037674.1 DUF2628 domain-containing protein [Pediococcus acidilactici]QQC45206.1 DUF2628 domain-containing protein [Pediococcus acidilactici]RJF52601.1 DUF2628 domain-containing protein [Pediococcus acidilactici]